MGKVQPPAARGVAGLTDLLPFESRAAVAFTRLHAHGIGGSDANRHKRADDAHLAHTTLVSNGRPFAKVAGHSGYWRPTATPTVGPLNKGLAMRIRCSHITTLLAAGAATLAIAGAPAASAADAASSSSSCNVTGGGTECQSPGNVEIYDSPPPINFDPYGDYGLALGGFGGGSGVHGGMHR
jgi:hypothetical protein